MNYMSLYNHVCAIYDIYTTIPLYFIIYTNVFLSRHLISIYGFLDILSTSTLSYTTLNKDI